MNRRDLIRSLAFIPLGAFLPASKPSEDHVTWKRTYPEEEATIAWCGVAGCPVDSPHAHWEMGAIKGCTADIPAGCDEAMKEHMGMTMRIFLNGQEVSPPVIKTERDTLSIAYTSQRVR